MMTLLTYNYRFTVNRVDRASINLAALAKIVECSVACRAGRHEFDLRGRPRGNGVPVAST